jgi:hypothetical protein
MAALEQEQDDLDKLDKPAVAVAKKPAVAVAKKPAVAVAKKPAVAVAKKPAAIEQPAVAVAKKPAAIEPAVTAATDEKKKPGRKPKIQLIVTDKANK